MLEAAHIFVTQKPGCDKWYSWSAARGCVVLPFLQRVDIAGSSQTIRKPRSWAALIWPRVESQLLNRPSVFLMLSIFMEGPLRKTCKRIPGWKGLTRTGALSPGLLIVSCNHPEEKCLSENLYPEQPRCFYFIGNIKRLTAGIFFPCLGSWGAQSQICSGNLVNL